MLYKHVMTRGIVVPVKKQSQIDVAGLRYETTFAAAPPPMPPLLAVSFALRALSGAARMPPSHAGCNTRSAGAGPRHRAIP